MTNAELEEEYCRRRCQGRLKSGSECTQNTLHTASITFVVCEQAGRAAGVRGEPTSAADGDIRQAAKVPANAVTLHPGQTACACTCSCSYCKQAGSTHLGGLRWHARQAGGTRLVRVQQAVPVTEAHVMLGMVPLAHARCA